MPEASDDTDPADRAAAVPRSTEPANRVRAAAAGGLPLAADRPGSTAPPTLLPADPAAASVPADPGEAASTDPTVLAGLRQVARDHPASSLAWAALAEAALAGGDDVAGYAFARTGYHRGLDQLRRNGWRGAGPVPWSHAPNRGFLRSVAALSRAAGAIGEDAEQRRCAELLRDSDPAAAAALIGTDRH